MQMQPNVAIFAALGLLLLLLAVIRWKDAVPLAEAPEAGAWPDALKADPQVAQPSNPRRTWPTGLTVAVMTIGILRVALLVTLHA